jgi:hypothetical protein
MILSNCSNKIQDPVHAQRVKGTANNGRLVVWWRSLSKSGNLTVFGGVYCNFKLKSVLININQISYTIRTKYYIIHDIKKHLTKFL